LENLEIDNLAKDFFSDCKLIYSSGKDPNSRKILLVGATRERYDYVKKNLPSFIEKADDIKNLKFIIGVDEDDAETTAHIIEFIKENYSDVMFEIYEFDRLGYKNLHVYQNTLILQDGLHNNPFIFQWSDDLNMNTDKWDSKIILKYLNNDPLIVFTKVSSGAGAGREIIFFFTSILIRVTNFLLLCDPASDRFSREVGKSTGIFKKDNSISQSHNRPYDKVFRDARFYTGSPTSWGSKAPIKNKVINLINEFKKNADKDKK